MELYNQLYDLIEKHNKIIIHRHKKPDFDCIGAQMALKSFLQLNFPTKEIYAVGKEDFEEFNFLGEVDNIIDEDYQNALIIVVDTANRERIEDNRYHLGVNIVKIDHHISYDDELYGTLNIINDKISSSCELLFNIFEYFQKLNSQIIIDKNICEKLFYGIYSDTGGFKFPNTTSDTFLVVSKLRASNFDYEKVMLRLTTYPYDIMKLVGYIYNNLNVNNQVGYIYFDSELQKKLNITPQMVSKVVNFIGLISELKIWVVFNQYPTFIRGNIRSREEYNVEVIAKRHNGGGHKNASGIKIFDDKEILTIIKELEELV